MKIRIKGNSLRYRLTRPEVEQFHKTGYLEEKIDFVGNSLHYCLCTRNQEKLSASFYDNQITVYIPDSGIEEWKTTEQIGFEGEMELEGTEENSIYWSKRFYLFRQGYRRSKRQLSKSF
jgi:hypothetical protein